MDSFLSARYQQINGVLSEPDPVLSGVPQGSFIGTQPICSKSFSLTVTAILSSLFSLTKISRGIADVTDASALQNYLEIVYQRAEENNMSFNYLKFESLRFGLDQTLKLIKSYTSPSGNNVER